MESIKQVWKKDPTAKILVAAPSNAAADLLAVKLLDHIPVEQLIRLNAAARDDSAINETLTNRVIFLASTIHFENLTNPFCSVTHILYKITEGFWALTDWSTTCIKLQLSFKSCRIFPLHTFTFKKWRNSGSEF